MSFQRRFANLLIVACFSVLMQLAEARTPRSPKEPSCVVADIDTPVMPACVVQTRDKTLYIPKKYWTHTTFNRSRPSGFSLSVASTSTVLGAL
jgi:hypothetical protein